MTPNLWLDTEDLRRLTLLIKSKLLEIDPASFASLQLWSRFIGPDLHIQLHF